MVLLLRPGDCSELVKMMELQGMTSDIETPAPMENSPFPDCRQISKWYSFSSINVHDERLDV
jgi:hypothetical protein